MKTVKINDINTKLAIFENGNKENHPILFIHGFPYDHSMWDKQIEELCKNYFCVSYDIRGLGESPAGDGQFTMESLVDDLFEIVDNFELKKPILCGLSMGGYISLRALERNQERFAGAILCDTKSEADNNEGKLKRAAGIKTINNDGLDVFVNGFVPNCFGDEFKIKQENDYKEIIQKCSSNDPVGVKGCLLAMLGRTDTTESLGKIKIPVFLICGNEDKLTPPDIMKEMSDKINNSSYVIIDGAGHMTPIESPKKFNEIVTAWLKENNL